jgi:hypothetical protein
MSRLYLLQSAAVVGLMLLGGTGAFAKGGGHGHGGHSHSSHSHASGSHHSSHHSSAHHSSPHPVAHALVAGHSTVNHGASHSGHSWHHHGWGNGYWSNGYWYGSGDGYVAPAVVDPWYYDQYWSVAPTPLVTPATGEVVTNEYLNATPPVGPLPSPSGSVETCPTASDGE